MDVTAPVSGDRSIVGIGMSVSDAYRLVAHLALYTPIAAGSTGVAYAIAAGRAPSGTEPNARPAGAPATSRVKLLPLPYPVHFHAHFEMTELRRNRM